MAALSDKTKSVDQVFLVRHRNLDLDALGSAVGMQLFASNIIEKAYVVYDDQQMGSDIYRSIQKLTSEGADYLLSISEAMNRVTSRSLLIMVDHSKLALTLSRELFDRFSQTIVVDHHRRDEDFPENAVIAYIESGASSA